VNARRLVACAGVLAMPVLVPASGGAQVALGDSLWDAGRLPEAAAAYTRALAEDRHSVRANLRLARTLAWASRFDESERAYRELLARPPTDKQAARDAELGLVQLTSWTGALSAAARRYDALLAADPGDPRALQGLAAVRNWQGRPRASIVLLERALQRDSTNGELRVLLATARTAAAPTAEFEARWSDDSDGDQNVWWTGSQAAFLGERVRGGVNVGQLQARDAGRHSQRLHGEATIAVTLDDVRFGGALGVRALNVGTLGMSSAELGDRTAVTARVSAAVRLPGNARVGVGVSHAPLDEVAGLIAKAIDVTSFDVNGDYTPRRGLNVALALNALQITDGNHRTSVTLRAAQRLPARLSIGKRALGRFARWRIRHAVDRPRQAVAGRVPCRRAHRGPVEKREHGRPHRRDQHQRREFRGRRLPLPHRRLERDARLVTT